MSRKRPRSEALQLPVLHQSRLRAARGKPMGSAPYTPTPMLNPTRPGPGLYWNAKMRSTGSIELCDDSSSSWSSDSVPESDSTPHINVGPDYQCLVPCFPGHDRIDREPTYEHLLWDPGINSIITDAEVDMYLDFACCAAVPGGGRNKEYALHLLNLSGGNIHDAMLRLMQPAPSLPTDHHLLHYQYGDSDRWSEAESDAFFQALLKHDKDFFNVAQEIGTKTVKQCVQFYYLWKKVCNENYRKVRQARDRRHGGNVKIEPESDLEDKPYPDTKLLGIADAESPLPVQPEHRHFMCEFAECSASFNSRAALNGHIRIHGGTARRSPTPTSHPERRTHSSTPIPCAGDSQEDYPCKICGKVFSKIKSRSAHMKSHRPPDAEPKRKSEPPPTVTYDTASSP